MNAKEQMQALLDGKIIVCERDYFKLNDKGNLVVCYGPLEEGKWGTRTCKDFVISDENYVFDDTKYVDFYHALGKMAEGKVMKSLWSKIMFRIHDGALQVSDVDGWGALAMGELLVTDEMESMWMEVDE